MHIRIKPADKFDSARDAARKKIWLNTWDSGSVTLFADDVIHACSKATKDDLPHTPDDRPMNCPNSCGVTFYPRAYKATRELYGL